MQRLNPLMDTHDAAENLKAEFRSNGLAERHQGASTGRVEARGGYHPEDQDFPGLVIGERVEERIRLARGMHGDNGGIDAVVRQHVLDPRDRVSLALHCIVDLDQHERHRVDALGGQRGLDELVALEGRKDGDLLHIEKPLVTGVGPEMHRLHADFVEKGSDNLVTADLDTVDLADFRRPAARF